MQNFSPVSNKKLYIQIFNQLYDAIVSGKIKAGEKLPSEKELCLMFNVSRVPVREALCALEMNGIVDSVQGGGVFVKEHVLISKDILSDVDPQDIISARVALEPIIARESATHIDDDGRAKLEAILEEFSTDRNKGISTEIDKNFHLLISQLTGNNLYVSFMNLIYAAMEQKMWKYILRRSQDAMPEYIEESFHEHMLIGRAILDGRGDDAYDLMTEHMKGMSQRYWGIT